MHDVIVGMGSYTQVIGFELKMAGAELDKQDCTI